MKAKIFGMVCGVNPNGSKDKDGNPIPISDIYSSGEVVHVRNLSVKPETIGKTVDVLCDIQLKDFDGRKYLSVSAVSE